MDFTHVRAAVVFLSIVRNVCTARGVGGSSSNAVSARASYWNAIDGTPVGRDVAGDHDHDDPASLDRLGRARDSGGVVDVMGRVLRVSYVVVCSWRTATRQEHLPCVPRVARS